MKSRSTYSTDPVVRAALTFTLGLAVCVAAFLLLVGLGPDALPFPVGSIYSDAVTSHWPNALFLKRTILEDHTFPLWRPQLMSGQPFAANPLNKVWYPFQWFVLLVSPTVNLNVLVWLHLVLAGLGMWVWSRGTGLQPLAAALSAGGYAFAPRLIAALGAGHFDLIYAAAWLPWLMWAMHHMIAPGARLRWAGWSAVFAALAVVADVRLGAYALALALAYMLWRVWTARGTEAGSLARVGGRLAVFLLLVAALTALIWVPLGLYRGDLSRGSMTLDDAAVESLTAGQWIGLVLGNHGGAWESMVYVGISTLVLALVTLVQRPRQFAFWWIVLLLAALYAMGDHGVLWTVLNTVFGFLRWWRVPPRVWLLAAWILPYLAGWGAQILVTDPPQRRLARLGVVALFGGGLTCGIFSALMLTPTLKLTAALGVLALPAVALVMFLALTRRVSARIALMLFALIVWADVVWIDRTLVEGRTEQDWLDPYAELATYLQEQGAARVYSPSYSLPQQAAAQWRIAQFGGVDPFQSVAYDDAFAAATGVTIEGYSVTLPPYELAEGEADDDLTFDEILLRANRDANLRADLLAQWQVSHVVAAFPLDTPGLELVGQVGNVYVYRNTFDTGTLVAWQGPNRVTVTVAPDTEGPVYAVAAGRWHGAPESDEPGLPGTLTGDQRTWTLTYDPSEVWYSLAAMIILGGAAALLGRRVTHV